MTDNQLRALLHLALEDLPFRSAYLRAEDDNEIPGLFATELQMKAFAAAYYGWRIGTGMFNDELKQYLDASR